MTVHDRIRQLPPDRRERGAKAMADLARRAAERTQRPVPEAALRILNRTDTETLVARQQDRIRRTGGEAAAPVLLPDLWEASVATNPESTALIHDPSSGADPNSRVELSYRDVDERANRLARHLLARGAGPETLVAIVLSRSADSVITTIAVTKTGAAWVPIDPQYPPDRISHMLHDSEARLGVTTTDQRPDAPDTDWVLLDDPATASAIANRSADGLAGTERAGTLHPLHPVYVMYSSGVTGIPKGVVVTHTGLSNVARQQRERFGVTTSSRVLHFTSPSFDGSVLELLMAYGAGASLVVAASDVYGGEELADVLRRESVTHAFATPAALVTVEGDVSRDGLPALATVVAGGDTPAEVVRRWSSGRRMFKGYGPTEATIVAATAQLRTDEPTTIGVLDGVRALVLDSLMHSVHVGMFGELYLGGIGVARGYLGRSESSAARFVADPFTAGERLYRTGDVVRWTVDGNLEFLRQDDSQVKIRGFRVELGEVDEALTALDAIRFAYTRVASDDAGRRTLASYVVAKADQRIDVAAVRAAVRTALPAHMVPDSVTVLPEMPLTPNAKIDIRGLPAPGGGGEARDRSPRQFVTRSGLSSSTQPPLD
ncbi:amino acid adenylation domain-containing protein [Rhodococcus erythropolis]|nr:amino acid adenylation domain-containing protein [Rhodococcus erythropolis]